MTKIEHTLRLAQMALGYWKRTLEPGYKPIRMWVEPTNTCNLKCVMCPQSSDTKFQRGFMEFSLFQKIIDEARKCVYDMNLHHSGESLLHPEIIEMIRYAKQAGIYTRLHTNATRLDNEKAKGILDAGLDFLSFSFDGYDKDTYENIRHGANFENTLENILNFLRLKKTQGKQRPFTVFEVIDFSAKPGTPSGLIPVTDAQLAFQKQFDDLPLNKFVLKAPHNWAGTYDAEGNPLHPEKYCACTFPWYALVVFWNGNVSPCPQDFFNNLWLGNLNDSNIQDVWHGESLITIREKMKYKKYHDLNPCKTCDLLYRDSFFGIPGSHLKNFIRESLGK
jgi:radical SAM protein with 4Fe4S-binding SPASM domain